ncbi:hypothetical protein B0H17DRAFT_1076918, partial [Mycena rosella]
RFLRQKEVLRTLELSKLARLPLEISSEIFIQCLSIRPKPGARHAPMVLANICTSWEDIALSTPSLWAAIDADKPISDLATVVAPTPHAMLTMYHSHDQDDRTFSTALQHRHNS